MILRSKENLAMFQMRLEFIKAILVMDLDLLLLILIMMDGMMFMLVMIFMKMIITMSTMVMAHFQKVALNISGTTAGSAWVMM